MATNKLDDKALAEDQAFIQSLYDDLSVQQDDHATDQPSKQLDQRIIAAAHKAVATKPTQQKDFTPCSQTGDNLQTLQQPVNKRNKIAWYYPAAMAASVVLVVTIINHQLNAPIIPGHEGSLASKDHLSRSEQSESLAAFVAETDLRASNAQSERTLTAQQKDSDQISAKEFDDAFADSEQTLIASAQTPVFADKKTKKSSLSKAEVASEPLSTARQQSAEAESVIAAVQAKQAPSVADRQLEKPKVNSPLSPATMSSEEYKTLQAQSTQKPLYWSLQQENESSYVIELFITEQTSYFYRLNKHSFQLNSNSEDTRQPFAEITFIAEN